MVSALEAPAAQDLVGPGSETPDYGAVSALPIMAGEDRGAVNPPPAPVPVSLESASGAAVEESRQPAPELTPQESPEAEAAPEPASPDSDFDFLVESGFVCLRKKDHAGARAHWNRAAALRPDDRRLKANLRRLDKLAE